ncbi:uncharacterized protein LOC108735369 [Agrilus planipennis]|uniref:Uncharacterized protein LOC108735369 n=1 Tax=Agrilus planipennis TaxID=224129 RepID=A0A1W4WFV2_AGRPL|nr:uncharacterized protein LOC108735369 [Agrilus planipennis]
MATNNSIMLIQIPRNSLNNSADLSLSASPSQELRGLKLFRVISKKLARKSQEDLNNEDTDSRCSSSDSCSSTSTERTSRSAKKLENYTTPNENGLLQSSRHKHSVSMENFKKMFEGLSIDTSRSQSCSRSKQKRKSSKKSSPKKILRSPVTYTYVKGLSGLPTQRIPRSEVRIYTNGSCRCSMQCIKSLNR